MCCNDIPSLDPNDGGLWRRVRVTEFKSRFVNNPDPSNPREFHIEPVNEKFEEWREIFMSWLLNRWYQKIKRTV